MAPDAGFEPATNRLTAGCSTAELIRNIEVLGAFAQFVSRIIKKFLLNVKSLYKSNTYGTHNDLQGGIVYKFNTYGTFANLLTC